MADVLQTLAESIRTEIANTVQLRKTPNHIYLQGKIDGLSGALKLLETNIPTLPPRG